MDLIEGLPKSDGYDCILVVVDRLTKMALFIPTSRDLTAESLASLYLEHVFSKHGIPQSVISDRGSEFTSRFWRSFTKLLGIELCFSTAYHPESDGQTERTNQSLEQYLRMYLNYKQDDWVRLLPLAEFAYNNMPHSATTVSPFFANKGYHPRSIFTPADTQVHSPAARNNVAGLADLHDHLQEQMTIAASAAAHFYNRRRSPAPDFKNGQLVWLDARNIKTTRPMKKLDLQYLGPFPIIEKVSPLAYRLELPSSMGHIHNVFHVRLLERYDKNTIPGRTQPPPPPIEIEGDLEYEIEDILDS